VADFGKLIENTQANQPGHPSERRSAGQRSAIPEAPVGLPRTAFHEYAEDFSGQVGSSDDPTLGVIVEAVALPPLAIPLFSDSGLAKRGDFEQFVVFGGGTGHGRRGFLFFNHRRISENGYFGSRLESAAAGRHDPFDRSSSGLSGQLRSLSAQSFGRWAQAGERWK
jgi:hypothetical protein